MQRDELDSLIAELMTEHFERLRVDLWRDLASKPVPPFRAPAPWTEGRHGAGIVVRHRNGLFMAQRDTSGEPGVERDAWLPLVVGVAEINLAWQGERTFAARIELSDGCEIEIEREIAVPIYRGAWEPGRDYEPGDRVARQGEFEACAMSKGIDPVSDAAAGFWVKIAKSRASAPVFTLDDDGTLRTDSRAIGSLKPLLLDTLKRAGIDIAEGG